jgi:hypothetical protein
MEAHAVWLTFPGEIAADLSRFHHRRIADWHQGTLCSYELLELCEYMPEHGALKPAIRRANPLHPWLLDPSEPEAALLQAANELAILRAVQAPQADSEEIGSKLFITPSRMRDLVMARVETDELREDVFAMADRTSADEDGEG